MPSSATTYLFAGDSLTEGRYGESYVERVAGVLDRAHQGQAEFVNLGRSGETVRSCLARLDGSLDDYQPDWVVLAVGSNDVWLPWLSAHSLGWRLWLLLRRLRWGQRPAEDLDRFAAAYRALIDEVQARSDASVLACTLSPLGERISTPVNRRLARLNGVIKHVAVDCHVPVADVWQTFVERLATVPDPSGYVANEWLFVPLDRSRLRTASPDEVSRRRKLHFTFDGIHLNSRGADLWAATILLALARAQGMPLPPELAA